MFKEILENNDNIIVKDKELVLKILKKIKSDGKDSLQVISDYDRTLTSCFINGKRVSTNVGLLRKNGYLSKDYAKKAEDLFNKYHPIEISTDLSIEERKEAMFSWWTEHIDVMVESGMNKKVIETLANDSPKMFREKTIELFESLNENKVPLLIFTAGFGDMVRSFLKDKNVEYKNIHIIGNYFNFDDDGYVTGYRGEIVHSLNKSQKSIINPSYETETKDRKNVILLGDFEGDVGMIDGVEYNNTIKICFLNEKVEERIEKYKELFDIIILNDGSMEPVYNILKYILD